MTKKELKERKLYLSRQIRNIREDYSGCDPEDVPNEINEELRLLLKELIELRTPEDHEEQH